jgi:uncharacterized membrane protein YkvA (DUF1232 family)
MTKILSRVSLVRTLVENVRLAVRLMREPRVPWWIKAILPTAAVYVVSPIDIIPDFMPVIGELDDLGLVVMALILFLRLCPTDALDFHRRAIDAGQRYTPMRPEGDYIDAEWRRGE